MKRILIIDDNIGFLKMLTKVIEHQGYEVVQAQNGLEGYQRFTENPCDLVITDIFMPKQEGLETIIQLRGQFPDLKIIAISGGGNMGVDYLEGAKTFGADRVFSKSLDMDTFLATIRELLEESAD